MVSNHSTVSLVAVSSPVNPDVAVPVRVVGGVLDVLLEEPGKEIHRYFMRRDVGPAMENSLI